MMSCKNFLETVRSNDLVANKARDVVFVFHYGNQDVMQLESASLQLFNGPWNHLITVDTSFLLRDADREADPKSLAGQVWYGQFPGMTATSQQNFKGHHGASNDAVATILVALSIASDISADTNGYPKYDSKGSRPLLTFEEFDETPQGFQSPCAPLSPVPCKTPYPMKRNVILVAVDTGSMTWGNRGKGNVTTQLTEIGVAWLDMMDVPAVVDDQFFLWHKHIRAGRARISPIVGENGNMIETKPQAMSSAGSTDRRFTSATDAVKYVSAGLRSITRCWSSIKFRSVPPPRPRSAPQPLHIAQYAAAVPIYHACYDDEPSDSDGPTAWLRVEESLPPLDGQNLANAMASSNELVIAASPSAPPDQPVPPTVANNNPIATQSAFTVSPSENIAIDLDYALHAGTVSSIEPADISINGVSEATYLRALSRVCGQTLQGAGCSSFIECLGNHFAFLCHDFNKGVCKKNEFIHYVMKHINRSCKVSPAKACGKRAFDGGPCRKWVRIVHVKSSCVTVVKGGTCNAGEDWRFGHDHVKERQDVVTLRKREARRRLIRYSSIGAVHQ